MYGVGAVKAGTSWLYSYLEGHPECAMPPFKELRYFYILESGYFDGQIKLTRNLVQELKQSIENGTARNESATKLRLNKTRHWLKVLQLRAEAPEAYADYMMDLADGAKLTADITPEYSMMPVSRLKQMARLAKQTRFVYILRDPVERLWSNIRMNAKRKSDSPELIRGHALVEVDEVLNGKPNAAFDRSDYAQGLASLEQAIPEANRKVLFYENLFSDDTIRDLCGFLGLSYHPAPLKKRIHAGIPVKLDTARRNGLQKLLAPQYHAVEKRFQSLPALWQDNMARV